MKILYPFLCLTITAISYASEINVKVVNFTVDETSAYYTEIKENHGTYFIDRDEIDSTPDEERDYFILNSVELRCIENSQSNNTKKVYYPKGIQDQLYDSEDMWVGHELIVSSKTFSDETIAIDISYIYRTHEGWIEYGNAQNKMPIYRVRKLDSKVEIREGYYTLMGGIVEEKHGKKEMNFTAITFDRL